MVHQINDDYIKNELPLEIPAKRGFSLSYKGKVLLSKIDPVNQAERLVQNLRIRERTLYLCPSPLYGYGLSALLDRIDSNSAVLCVEADIRLFEIAREAIKKIFEEKKTGSSNQQILLAIVKPSINAGTGQEICALVNKTWGERSFQRVELVRLNGGWQLFPELYEKIAGFLQKDIAVSWTNAMTMIRLGRLYIRNTIRNLPLLAKCDNISSLNFNDAPVLVLGAGPSLDSLLDELSALAGGEIPGPGERSFRIICVDTCLQALHARRIQPDLVVILESQHWNLRAFSGAKGRNINAAIDLSALPASAKVLDGKIFLFVTPWTTLKLWKRLEDNGLLPGLLPPLGSVGLSTVALALRISSGPVISGGIDFSYTLDAYHARSTPGHIDMELKQNRLKSIINLAAFFREGSFPALSKTGKQVRSDPSLRNYRNLFEQEFGGNTRIFDIGGSGLPLGLKTILAAEAFEILNSPGKAVPLVSSAPGLKANDLQIAGFVRREINTLNELKGMLSGEIPIDPVCLEELLDTADYLWAHFPDCAGAGGRRPQAADISFLKRVRIEIEPFLRLWEMALR